MAEAKSEEWRGKVGKMTEEEMAGFLSGNPFCRIGCLDDDGWPYVVPCWFEYSDGGFYIVPRARSAWASYIQRDGRSDSSRRAKPGGTLGGDRPPDVSAISGRARARLSRADSHGAAVAVV